jgi:hypothetical protein
MVDSRSRCTDRWGCCPTRRRLRYRPPESSRGVPCDSGTAAGEGRSA